MWGRRLDALIGPSVADQSAAGETSSLWHTTEAGEEGTPMRELAVNTFLTRRRPGG